MSITAREQEERKRKPKELIPNGDHLAVCYSLYDLGHQLDDYDTTFKEEEREQNRKHQIMIIWEIPSIRMKYEKNGEMLEGRKSKHRVYTKSLHEKSKLREHLEDWRDKPFTREELSGFEMESILGKSCMLKIRHKPWNWKGDSGIKDAIHRISPVPKGTEIPEVENSLRTFSFEGVDPTIPDDMPEWIQKIIHKSAEWQIMVTAGDNALSEQIQSEMEEPDDFDPDDFDPDDDIPF